MSPDTVSSLFPDRPIRPLPKRRLREKLSPEAAHTIKYPPSTHDAPPLFQYPPYSPREDGVAQWSESPSAGATMRRLEASRNYTPRPQGPASVEGGQARSALVTRSPPEILTRGSHPSALSRTDDLQQMNPQPPLSSASSVDGYDSFENTNNKKKRKIPSAGDLGHSGSHGLSSDISSLSISADSVTVRGDHTRDKSYLHASGYSLPGSYPSSSPGVSGSGRGRLGRSINGRSPLRSLPDGSNIWPNRAPRPGGSLAAEHEGIGIITSAIANAGKHPPQGQENISLLQQYSANNKTTPASTQFTFTCDSQVPGTVQWPGPSNRHTMNAEFEGAGAPRVPTTGPSNPHEAVPQSGRRGPHNSRKKERRRLEKELTVAARHRRQAAAENYYHSPPKLEDIWICEFCEYERIFGEPPRALIREYELKERRVRQEMAERKRMVEKAKAKARKNRKSAKASAKANHPAGQIPDQVHVESVDEHGAPQVHPEGHSTQSEEDYEDEIDDDYHRPPPPGPAAADPDGRRVPLPPWPGPGP